MATVDPPAPLATSADVAELWRTLTADETARVDLMCARASKLLRNRLRNIDDRIALDPEDPASLDPDVVSTVVAGMVRRVVSNPDGAWSRSSTQGPFSESMTFLGSRAGSAATASGLGELTVTASDIAQLTPTGTKNLPGTIRVKAALAPHGCDAELLESSLADHVQFDYPNYGDIAP